VRKISLSSVAGGTQLDVSGDGPVDGPHLFTLSGPDRVVLDLPATVHDARRSPLPKATGLVSQVAQWPPRRRYPIRVGGRSPDGRAACRCASRTRDSDPDAGPANGGRPQLNTRRAGNREYTSPRRSATDAS
jgi:hypothetical protein